MHVEEFVEARHTRLRFPGGCGGPTRGSSSSVEDAVGSTLIASLLDAHPAIRCEGELLMHRLLLPLTYVDGRCGAAGRTGTSAYGFKILTHHLMRDRGIADPRPFIAKLRDRGYRAVRVAATTLSAVPCRGRACCSGRQGTTRQRESRNSGRSPWTRWSSCVGSTTRSPTTTTSVSRQRDRDALARLRIGSPGTSTPTINCRPSV